jgi:hypothetical protein
MAAAVEQRKLWRCPKIEDFGAFPPSLPMTHGWDTSMGESLDSKSASALGQRSCTILVEDVVEFFYTQSPLVFIVKMKQRSYDVTLRCSL